MKFQKDDEAQSEDLTVSAHGKMDLQDLMDLWDRNEAQEDHGFDNEAERPDIPGEVDDFATEDIEEELPEIAAYRNLLSSSAAYEWLLGTIQREIQLNPTAPNAQGSIRDEILKSIPIPRVVSRYDAPQICQTTFTLNWDPLGFIIEQEYEKSVEGFLGKIITITGSSCDAQAMTSLQYLQQTWHSYATELLQLVEATIIGEPGSEYACKY